MNGSTPPTIPGSANLASAQVSVLKAEDVIVTGDLVVANVAAETLSLSTAKTGSFTLVAGTKTVSTLVELVASDKIFLSRRTTGGAAFGVPVITATTLGVAGVAAFTVTSKDPADGTTTVATDVGIIDWVVIGAN
jgi:hypothetical protein